MIAANYKHAGKQWEYNETNYVKDLETQPTTDHFVFSIPKAKLKSNASMYGDWKDDNKDIIPFLFFLEYVNHLSKSKNYDKGKLDKKNSKEDGQDVYLFSEIVRSKAGQIVGERIHVFVYRGTILSGPILRSMFGSASKKRIFKPWEYHQRHVQCPEDYIQNVCDTYLGNRNTSAKITNAHQVYDEIRGMRPQDIFSLDHFKIDGACDEQNDKEKYDCKFPKEEDLTRRTYNEIEASYLWTKYLVMFQSQYVDRPYITVEMEDVIKQTRRITVQQCPPLCIVEDLLGNDLFGTITKEQYEALVEKCRGIFTIRTCGDTPDGGTNVSFTHRYEASAPVDHRLEALEEIPDIVRNKYQNQHSISAFDLIAEEVEWRKMYNGRAHEMVDKFEQMCVSTDADISDAGKTIARWKLHTLPVLYERFGSFAFEIKDPTLSPFANMQYWFSQALDSYMCVASVHLELIKLHYAVYDAYRQHGQNQLHWNMIYTGESATSKSYVFEQEQCMSIPGTINELTYQTTRADNIDGDQNDHITVFNEAPPGLFSNPCKGEDAQKALSSMKEKLTSNRSRTKEFVRDERTGERKNRTAISSQIGCYVGATNDNPAEAEEAMRSRFHWGEFDKVFREDKSIADYQRKASDMEGNPKLKEKYDHFIYYCQDQQMKVFYIWKFIFCGIIQDVSLHAADVVLTSVGKEMKRNQIQIPARTIERYRILCRILTMTNALDIVFNFKGGRHNGKPFELNQLLDVEPLLYCTEEIAICALNMVAVEVPQLTVSRAKTLRAMWSMFQSNPMFKKDKDIITGTTEKMDYNYIRFTGGVKQLCVKIQNAIPYQQGKPSLHNIHSVLQSLSKEPFRAHEHQCRDDFEAENPRMERYFNDVFSVPKIGSEDVSCAPKGPKKAFSALSFGNNFQDVHIGLFEDIRLGNQETTMNKCLKRMCHKYTKPRRVVTGVPERVNGVIECPQFMQIIQLDKGKNEPPVIRNTAQETKGVQRMLELQAEDHDETVLDIDIDEYAWSQRTEHVESHPDVILETIRVSTSPLSYPHDLKAKPNQEKKRRKASELLQHCKRKKK